MRESDVRGKGSEEQRRGVFQSSSDPGQGSVPNAPEPTKRKADDEWLAFATEDPAFFIKPSDTV